MTAVTGQDSNNTSIRYAFEQTLGALPVTPDWILAEPNTEPDFGGDIKTMSRDIINADRQSVKGSVVDVEAGVTIEQDFTLTNQRALLQAFMFANERGLVQAATLTTITGGTTINGTGMAGFVANDIVLLSGSGLGSDGAYLVASATGTTVVVAGLNNGTLAAGATLVKVGIQCAAADINVVISGPFASYTSTATNFTTRLALAPGQSVYVGGDLAAEQFVNAANNGSKRVLSATATNLQVDKSHLDMIAETGTGKTIRFIVTGALKNEQGVLFVTKPTQWERTLGAPDDASPAQVQSQYEVGCLASEYTFDAKPASKITTTMKFMGKDEETRTGVLGVKTGNRPALPNVDAVNTSSDPRRFRVAQVNTVVADEAPNPLWAITESLSFTINNNIERNLALGSVGAARFTIGSLDVTGSMTPYFADISVLAAARANVDVTADLFVASKNSGFAIDFPLMTLSKARAEVSRNKAIMVPCDFVAHSGEKVNPALDHTIMWTWFLWLPNLAQTQP
jgi:hypothetical protein